MQAGNDCEQAIPSSAFLVLNDENEDTMLPVEVCNASDSNHIQLNENSTTLTLLITLKCSSFFGYGSQYSGDLVLNNIGGTSTIPGVTFGEHPYMLY